jgi:hypothetical protein
MFRSSSFRKNPIETQSEDGIAQQTELNGKSELGAGAMRRNACESLSHSKMSTDIWIVTATLNSACTM